MIDPTRPIHVTERGVYRQCRRKWHYQFVDRLAVQTQHAQADALFLGSGGHKALEEWYTAAQNGVAIEDRAPLHSTWDNYVRENSIVVPADLDDMMRGVLANYQTYSTHRDRYWRIVEVERRFTVELPGVPVKLTGAFDLIVEVLKGDEFITPGLWIVDHKFLSNMPNPKHLEMDDQMTAYIWIARNQGIKVNGIIYNAIKKKVPAVPFVLKSGALSQNKMQDTTYDLYLSAIDSLGHDSLDYADMLEHLKNKPDNFNQRHVVTRNRAELNGFYDLLMMEITEMSDTRTFIYPNPGYMCNWCQFQTLCKATSEGGDIELTKKLMYREKEDYER